MPKDASQHARFNGAHNFGVSTTLVVKIDIKKLFHCFLEISSKIGVHLPKKRFKGKMCFGVIQVFRVYTKSFCR